MKRTWSAAAGAGSVLLALTIAACRNGPNNAADTNGVGPGTAAGQVSPAADTGSAPAPKPDTTARADSTHRDSTARSGAGRNSPRPRG